MAFRNVRSLISNLGGMVDHAPTNIDVREFRVDALNRTYLALAEEYDWLFLQVEGDWRVYADRTADSTGIACGVTAQSYTVTATSALGTTQFLYDNEGQEWVDDDGTVYTVTRLFNGIGSAAFYLDRPYEGSTGSETDWTLRCRHSAVPYDCARPLAFIDREGSFGALPILDRRTEEIALGAVSDSTGRTLAVVEDTVEYMDPPEGTLVAADDTTAGSLVASATYEYCVTFIKGGRESPPSPPVRITLSSAANHRVQLTGIEDTDDPTYGSTGIRAHVYRRQLTRNSAVTSGWIFGRWVFLDELDGAVSYTDSGTTTRWSGEETFGSRPSVAGAIRGAKYHGTKWMRPKWVPSEDATLRMRYLRRPERLFSDSDVPTFPEAYHDIVMYGAAIDIGQQYGAAGDKLARWQNQYDRLLLNMKANHLRTPNGPSQRQRMNMGERWHPPYRAGVVTGDFG